VAKSRRRASKPASKAAKRRPATKKTARASSKPSRPSVKTLMPPGAVHVHTISELVQEAIGRFEKMEQTEAVARALDAHRSMHAQLAEICRSGCGPDMIFPG
jgi:hypothetical protein